MIQRMFVTLDTKKTNYKNVGKINHGDDLILELTVLSDGDMISFNDPMVDLLVKKSDGKMIRQNSGIEHIKPNKFVIEVMKDCVTSPGLSTNQLIINDNGRISTCMFYYTILNSLEEDIIQSISNVEVLEQLDEFTIQMKDKMENFDDEFQNRISELEDAIDDLEEFFGDTGVDLLEAEFRRNEAEQSRAKAESIRIQNESRRLQNDLDLANAEAERVRAENIRIQNEADRALVDAAMDQKEFQREDSELERIQNESKRITDEVARQQNENTRQSNESIRMNNETDRKTQENRRVTAETNRVNAETTRRNNENSRISNETERQKAMNEMKSLLEDARGFDERVGVIEDDIDEINSSLDNVTNRVANIENNGLDERVGVIEDDIEDINSSLDNLNADTVDGKHFIVLTQFEYDTLSEKDENTFYAISDAKEQQGLTDEQLQKLNSIDTKVDKVDGKSLIADTEITRLASVRNYDDSDLREYVYNIKEQLDNISIGYITSPNGSKFILEVSDTGVLSTKIVEDPEEPPVDPDEPSIPDGDLTIITDNLIFNLDGKNPGTDSSIWKDTTENGNDFTKTGFTTTYENSANIGFTNDALKFKTPNDSNADTEKCISNVFNTELLGDSNWTLQFKQKEFAQKGVVVAFTGSNNKNTFVVRYDTADGKLKLCSWGSANNSSGNINIVEVVNDAHITIVRNSGLFDFYVDGVKTGSNKAFTSTRNTISKATIGGVTNSNKYENEINYIRLYSTALTQEQITNNYNADLQKFGG